MEHFGKMKPWGTLRSAPRLTLELSPEYPLSTYYVINEENYLATEGGYSLREGDQLRIGKMELLVRRCREKQPEVLLEGTLPEAEGMCKFCLGETQTPSNFMVRPCLCKEPVHLVCLREWVSVIVREQRRGCVTSLAENILECKVCRANVLQSMPLEGGQEVDLFTFEGSYAIFDLVSNFRVLRSFLVEGLEDRSVVFGRMADCDICLPDISVSRIHS